MKPGKKLARKYIFPIIVRSGAEKSLRWLTKNSVLNILYHGVIPNSGLSFSPRHISIDQFELHLKYFTKEFEILSIPQAFDLYRNNIRPKRKALTISFDDGYKNNIQYALPLLEKYNVKATFFISGVCAEEMDMRCLWTDLLACLNYFHADKLIEIENLRFKNGFDESKNLKMSDYFKSLLPGKRETILTSLIKKYDLYNNLTKIPSEYWELMNKEDIQHLAGSGISDIGSHGHLHYNIGNLGMNEAISEMSKPKNLLEKASNRKIEMIAYPDGSYTAYVKDWASDLGYDKQLAVTYKLKDDIADKRILNRHGMASTTTYESNMFFLNYSFHLKGFLKNG